MAEEYTLIIQKTKTGAVVSTLADFGFAANEIPWPAEEFKELATRDWPGEHGEDVYLPPDGLKLRPFDVEVEFCFKGGIDQAFDAYWKFRGFLTGEYGDGAGQNIYDPYWRRGYAKTRITKIGDFDPNRTNLDESLSFKATFRVADPANRFTL